MKPYLAAFIFFLLILAPGFSTFSQTDTTFIELPDSIRAKEHSPTKATLMSMCLPGLGQIYNKKYWKVPIIYVGFGLMAYFIYFNTDEYLNYKCAYIESSHGITDGSYGYLVQRYSIDELVSAREYYRRNLEISILITVLWYAVNILDATVDAHLYTFNITDKLAVKVEPALLPTQVSYKPAAGLKLSLRF